MPSLFQILRAFLPAMACANHAAPLGLLFENVTLSSDGKTAARGIGIGIGTPQQIISFAPSIGDDNTWVFNAADCLSANNFTCIGGKGGVFNTSRSHTFIRTTEAQWNGSQQAVELDQGSFIFFNDNLYFGSNGSSLGFPLILDQPGLGKSSREPV